MDEDLRRLLAETDAMLEAERQRTSPVNKRYDGGGLVYKTRREPQPQEQMNTATQAQWDAWLQAHITRNNEIMVEPIAEFVSEYVNEKLGPLRAEIAALRAEQTIGRAAVKRLKGNVSTRRK